MNTETETPVTTREQYIALFETLSDAIEFENSVLSIGEDLLPPEANAVRLDNTVEPAPEYWTFLASQIEDDESDEDDEPEEYTLRDDDGFELKITAKDLDDAIEQARKWARDGDWDTSGGTVWVDTMILDDEGDRVAEVTEAIDPPEPKCSNSDSEHDWQSPIEVVGGIEENPGVWGHGGGVTITEVCAHCGAYRETDTWAQRSDTGEEGLHSVEYREPDDKSLEWVRGERSDDDDDDARESLANGNGTEE